MALVSGRRSTLNPDAPLFIPAAFRQVEDFSPEWWQLVTTSTWYRDYWLSEHPEGLYDNVDLEDEFHGSDMADLLPDSFDLNAEDFSLMESQFEEFIQFAESEGHELFTPAFDGTTGKGILLDSWEVRVVRMFIVWDSSHDKSISLLSVKISFYAQCLRGRGLKQAKKSLHSILYRN